MKTGSETFAVILRTKRAPSMFGIGQMFRSGAPSTKIGQLFIYSLKVVNFVKAA